MFFKSVYIKFVLLLCLFKISNTGYAQDLFLLNNGSDLNAKLLTIDSLQIKYFENGTEKTISKSDVFRITLQNGEKLLIKPETVFPPVLYEDLIIFTDGSDLKVKIISIINETINYLFENKTNSIHANKIKFLKYKDGKTIKGVDLIKYEDKAILKSGEELENIKYKGKDETHFLVLEKGKTEPTKLLFGDVFVIKLANGNKEFPPQIELKINETPKPIVDEKPKEKPILEPSKDTVIIKVELPKYGKIYLKDETILNGDFINQEGIFINYENTNHEVKKILLSGVDKIVDKNNVEINLSNTKSNTKQSTSNVNSFKNKNFSLAHQEFLGSSKLEDYSGVSAMGSFSLNFGLRSKKRIEHNFELIYSQFSNVIKIRGSEVNVVKSQLGVGIINRIYATKRFNFQLSPSLSRDIALKIREKPSGKSSYNGWEKFSTSDLSTRFHYGFQLGFGWKGRRAAFDIIYQNLDLKGSKDVVNASANLIGFRFEVILGNSNKNLWKTK